MSTALRRIQIVERQLASRRSDVVHDDDLAHLRWWSHPIFPGEFRSFCAHRAEARLRAEGGPCWYTGISEEERRRRTEAEWDELERLQAALGTEAGWTAWHEQARSWPQSHGAIDEAALERSLLHAFATADGHRAHVSRPLWRQVWPEWKPGMTLAEHLVFDQLLEAEGMERVERAAFQQSGVMS